MRRVRRSVQPKEVPERRMEHDEGCRSGRAPGRGFRVAVRLALAYACGVADVTRILNAIEQGDRKAAGELLPLVYDELRKLAAARIAEEKPGQTLQGTALVHEAYLRLIGG